MHVTHHDQARPYEAPGHHRLTMHRIQGMEVTPLQGLWSARLDLQADAHVEAKASPAAKLYLVTQGRVRFRGGEQTVELNAGDSVFVLPNEEREFRECAGAPAQMYLVMLEHYPAPQP